MRGCKVAWTETHGRLDSLTAAEWDPQRGDNESGITRVGETASAFLRVPYHRIEWAKDRTESRIFHSLKLSGSHEILLWWCRRCYL